MGRLSKYKGQALVPIKQGLNFQYALDTFKEIVAFHKQLANKALGKEDDFQKELEIGISLGEKDELEEVLDHISNSLVPAKERKETEKLIQDLVWSKWNWKSL